jgi:hypothetical protein
MKKLMLFSTVLITGFLQLSAQVTTEWVNQPRGVSIATDAFNNVYTVDWEYNPGGDITLTKRSTAGNILWQVPYDNTDVTRHEVATWVETDNQNNILVTGTIRSGYSNPVNAASVLMKYDPAGNLLWRKVYENSFDGSYTKKCLVDAANNIYVLGMGSGPAGFVTKVKKFAPDGSTVWTYYDDAGIGAPLNFKFTPDNKIVITGRGIIGSVNGYAKIDLNGNNIWNYPGVFSLYTGDAAGDSFGNTYITHEEYVFNGRGEIKKLSPSGTLLWEKFHTMVGYRVDVGSDNNPIISGFPNDGTAGAAFMKYDGNGNIVWENMDADGPALALLLHAQMQLDASGNAYLAAGTLTDMAVCKINSDGTAAWTQTTAGGFAYGFDIGADNNIYVVGGNTAKFRQAIAVECITPPGLFTSNISTVKVRLNWTAISGAVQYEVWARAINTNKWKKTLVQGSKNFLTIKGLNCGTLYEWKIRTICDSAGNKISVFSAIQNFTTATCVAIANIKGNNNAARIGSDKVMIYPNPVKKGGTLIIKSITAAASYTLFTIAGQQVAKGSYSTATINLPGHIMPGTYILEIKYEYQRIRKKIMVTE